MKNLSVSAVVLIVLIQTVISIDYYKILSVNKDATERDIAKAYRKLSLQYHPDRNPGDQEAAKKFMEVTKANEILTDPELRQIYDLQGEDGVERKLKGGEQYEPERRGPNMAGDIPVTLEDLYNGATREMNIRKNVICSSCRGTGAKDGKVVTCSHCQGRGFRMERVQVGIGFNMQMQVHCNVCGGKGKTHAEHCPKCGGRKVVPESKTLEVDIEKGMKDNERIVFRRESEQNPDYVPGDVIITLKQQPHSRFGRNGNNLHHDMTLNLKEALLGFSKQVKHLDSHYTEVLSKEVIQPFSVKVIKDQGMPVHNDPGSFGDMHVKFKVNLPRDINDQDRELLSRIFAMESS